MADLMAQSICWLNLWLWSYSSSKVKCRGPKSDADHQLEGGKWTHGGHQQFLMNNSSDNRVRQFSYGRFNGTVHLLIGFVVGVLFKFKGKMSAAPQVEITLDHHLRGEHATMVDTSNSLWLFLAMIQFVNSAMADLMAESICYSNLWLWSYSNAKAKCRSPKSDADHQLEGGKCN